MPWGLKTPCAEDAKSAEDIPIHHGWKSAAAIYDHLSRVELQLRSRPVLEHCQAIEKGLIRLSRGTFG